MRNCACRRWRKRSLISAYLHKRMNTSSALAKQHVAMSSEQRARTEPRSTVAKRRVARGVREESLPREDETGAAVQLRSTWSGLSGAVRENQARSIAPNVWKSGLVKEPGNLGQKAVRRWPAIALDDEEPRE